MDVCIANRKEAFKNLEVIRKRINHLTDDIRIRYQNCDEILQKCTYFLSPEEYSWFEDWLRFPRFSGGFTRFENMYDGINIKERPSCRVRVWECPVA